MAFEDRQYQREYEDGGGGGFGSGAGPKFIFPMPSMLTFALIIACVVIFFVQSFYRPVTEWGALTLYDNLAWKQPWRWITYQYLHGGGGHLFFNLIGIYFFVPPLEALWGWKRTLAFYTAGGLVSGIAFWLMSLLLHVPSALIGASGCVFAVLGALAYLVPDMQVLAMLAFPLSMRTLTLLYTVFFIFTVIGDRQLADAAHLGGLAFGFFAPYLAGPVWQRSSARWQQNRAVRAREQEVNEERQIDAILQKVHDHGMNSLTRGERNTLKRATERQRRAQMARASRRG
jgi:membrane associated rhomboid family serine protease